MGSEQISAKWVEGAKRVCVQCGNPIVNLERDVGVVRTRYGPKGHGTREIICMDCHVGPAREKLGRDRSSE